MAQAEETIALTEKLIYASATFQELIVGFELSDGPHKGSWDNFRHLLENVRTRLQLPISLHFGKTSNEEECLSMLDFHPDRVGHAVIMTDRGANRLLETSPKIGVEVCLNSNLITKSTDTVTNHPVSKVLIPADHPFCLCTDDCGIFDTTLSDEYGRLVECLNLQRADAEKLALRGSELAFCKDEELMGRLRQHAKQTFKS